MFIISSISVNSQVQLIKPLYTSRGIISGEKLRLLLLVGTTIEKEVTPQGTLRSYASDMENITMPKRTRVGYNGARPSKPRAQKGFELVCPERLASGEGEREAQKSPMLQEKPFEMAHSTATLIMTAPWEAEENQLATSKGSANARQTPRRAIRKVQQRTALITAEDFLYVKRDLITIGILTAIMIVVMVVLAFVLGIE